VADFTSPWFDHVVISVMRLAEEGVVQAKPAATHDHAALGFYTRGRASHFQQRERLELREGDVLLVPAGEPHRLEIARDPAAWGIGFCATCYAPSELAPLLDPFERARSGASPVVHIPGDRQQYLAYLCAELQREVTRGAHSAHANIVQKSLIGLILAEVKRAAAFSPPAELQTTLVGEALQFIELHCLEPISLREVAAAIRRSPAHDGRTAAQSAPDRRRQTYAT